MTVRDVGVFLNAEHLLKARSRHRTPAAITERIDAATTQLMLAGKVSHRVIAGDCSDGAVRELAERFALEEGFRIRHRPSAQSNPEILTSEIMESVMLAGVPLRVVVIGDEQHAYGALLPSLQRLGTWVVTLSTSGKPSKLGDLAFNLDLSPAALLAPIAVAESTLMDAGEAVTPGSLEKVLRTMIPGFRPAFYGHKKITSLLEEVHEIANGPEGDEVSRSSQGTTTHKPRAAVAPDADPVVDSRVAITPSGSHPAVVEDQPGSSNPGRVLTTIVNQAITAHRERPLPVTTDEYAEFMVSILTMIASDDHVRSIVSTDGIPFSAILDGLRRGLPGWQMPEGMKATPLMRKAAPRVGWMVLPSDPSGPARLVDAKFQDNSKSGLREEGNVQEPHNRAEQNVHPSPPESAASVPGVSGSATDMPYQVRRLATVRTREFDEEQSKRLGRHRIRDNDDIHDAI